jgi:hypothetical protein
MKKIICWFRGHKYRSIRMVSNQVQEVYCDRCMEEFAIHHGLGTILPMDKEIRDFNCWMRKQQRHGHNK